LKVGLFGTFDIGNFGDLMFPIIAERKLSELGAADITRFSYRAKHSDSWCYDVETIQSFPSHVGDTRLVIIGGGHLVHFSRAMAHGYGPSDRRIPHPMGFWWVPAVAARMAGIPAALNAVSVDSSIPKWAEPLMTAFVDSLDYVAVRDSQSQRRLERFAAGAEIKVVPDTVHSVSDLVQRGSQSAAFKDFSARVGLGPDYVIVQPSMILRDHRESVSRLIADAVREGFDVLELPIFREGVDVGGFYGSHRCVKTLDVWPEPLVLAEIIANSRSVIGVSLHLSIVAAAYGIPIHRPRYSAESKFAALDGLPGMIWLESSPGLSWRETRDSDVDLTEVERRKRVINEHWARVYELADSQRYPGRTRGWDQILQTPDAFRRAGGVRHGLPEVRRDISIRMRFLAHAVRTRRWRTG